MQTWVDPSRRKTFLGTPVDDLTLPETVALAKRAVVERRRLQHVALNTAKLINMRKNDILRRDVVESDVVNADGMGIVWGARLLGIQITERVTGVDLMLELLAVSEREGYRPYILGATPDVLDRALKVIASKYPDLRLAGSHHGYFLDQDTAKLVEEIRLSKPDLLFVAMSTPRKEQFMHRYRDDLEIPFLMGVGGTVDVIAGVVERAPAWMQRTGLEWLFRTIQEPRRMWRRYMETNWAFGVLLFREIFFRPNASRSRGA